MRIISGTHKGKRIKAPKKLPVRPTTDMAKEGLFNILNNTYYFDEVSVLDLFSGTGNISYEFASRGTKKSLCVDENLKCVNFINKTAKNLSFEGISIIQSDVFKFLTNYNQQKDIIFADPPYEMEGLNKIIDLVFEKKILSKKGTLVIEHSSKKDFSKQNFFTNNRRYGNVYFSFFKWEQNEE